MALLPRRALLAAPLAFACARPPPRSAPARQQYSERPLDYVPAAGLRWLVVISPAKLSENQSFRPALDILFSRARLHGYERSTGIELDRIEHAAIAGFDAATLYVARLPPNAAESVRARFEARQLRGANQRRPAPGLVVMTGASQGAPVGLATIDERVLAYSTGSLIYVRIAEAYALGKLKAKRAFEGAALSGLLLAEEAPIAAFVPGPVPEQWEHAAGGLLQVTTALTLRLWPKSKERGLAELTLHGDFTGAGATERLRAAYMSVAGSSTGALLGLASALDPRAIEQGDRVTLRVPLSLTEIARGARAATSADVSEIVRLSGPDRALQSIGQEPEGP
jgi:hypothetical protein